LVWVESYVDGVSKADKIKAGLGNPLMILESAFDNILREIWGF
jgi:hypothetical protein